MTNKNLPQLKASEITQEESMENKNSKLRKEFQRKLVLEAEEKKPMKDTEKKQRVMHSLTRKVNYSTFTDLPVTGW